MMRVPVQFEKVVALISIFANTLLNVFFQRYRFFFVLNLTAIFEYKKKKKT